MSNELQTILNDIKDQKDNYLKPENIVEGVELLGVKGNLKLPKPIYNTTSYRTLTIPSPDTSKYTQIYMLYSLGDYIIVSWKTSSYGSNYYLYKKVNNQYELLGDTKIGSPTSYATNAVICSYNDNYVYIAQGQRNNQNYTLATFDIVNKKATSKSVSTSIYTSNFVWSDINGYFMSARINSGYLYKLNGTSSSPTTTTLKSFSNCEYVYNKMLRIFGYSSTAITKLSFDNGTPIQTSATAPKNIKGVNYYGNKIFLADGIYQLSEQLTIGEKLNDINITKSKIYPLNDKYYMSSASSNKVVLYEFDEDTNLFKEVETISSTCANGGYETSATLFGLNYIYDFTQGDTLLGYEIDNQNVYLNTLRQISTDSILSGYSAYNFSGNPIVGTMPNNGKLTYNPSIANQSIPKGYTDGGTILGVTNEIDSNIQPENIKKDVVILNVTGTYEGASGEVERFDTVEEMQADTEVENGDLAVVYGDKFIDLPELEPFTKCKFPDTVVLESAPTEYKNYQGMGEANGAMLRVNCSLDSSSFDFYYMYENYDTEEITDTSISYTSTDGLTYTRSTESVSELEFPGAITMTDWDENISKFIQTPVKEYNGFYEYKKDYETGNVEAKSSVSYDSTNKKFVSTGTGHMVSVDILNKFHEKIVEYYSEADAGEVFISKDYKKLIWLSFTYSTPNLFLPDGEIYVPITDDRYTGTIKSFEYDIETETVSDFIMSTDTTTVTYSYSGSHTATVVPFTNYYLIGAVVKYADRKNVSVNGTYFFAFENGFTTQKAGNVSEPLLEILNEYTLVPGSLDTRLNIFVQEEEPDIKDGIWIQGNKTYDNIKVTDIVSSEPYWGDTNNSALPFAMPAYLMTRVQKGADVYIFNYGTSGFKYNLETGDYEKITYPDGFAVNTSCLYNDDIYLFGYSSTLAYKYNTITKEFIQLETPVPFSFSAPFEGVLVDDYIYLFGGKDGNLSSSKVTAYKYSIKEDKYTLLATRMPYKAYGGWSCKKIGNEIFIFGNQSATSTVYKYDIATDTYTAVAGTTHSLDNAQTLTCVIGTDIYYFGTNDSSSSTKASKYDTVTNTHTSLTDIPHTFYYSNSAGAVAYYNNKIYLMGGGSAQRLTIMEFPTLDFIDNSVIIQNGNIYKTQFKTVDNIIGRLETPFKDVFHYTDTNGLDGTLPTYYGNGEQWIKFKN